jgi:hypothetical protein
MPPYRYICFSTSKPIFCHGLFITRAKTGLALRVLMPEQKNHQHNPYPTRFSKQAMWCACEPAVLDDLTYHLNTNQGSPCYVQFYSLVRVTRL